MSSSRGSRILLVALLAAVVMAGAGFAAGFFTHKGLAAAAPAPTEIVTAPTEERPSSTPSPSAEPSDTPVPPTPTPTVPPLPDTDLGNLFDLFWEAWQRIERDYYGELPSDDEVVYGAIRGALNTLDDPFTGFIDPEAAAINREDDSGTFEGIGAFVSMEDGRLIIVEPMRGQPAEAAGIREGDTVLEVDGTVIENMSIYEAIGLIRGPAGTKVTLRLVRPGEQPFEVTITRARIEIPVVESEQRPDGIGYARLNDFSTDASARLGEVVDEMLGEGAKGLVLDLRGNPGGWLNEAVLVAGLFLPKDALVLIERSKDGSEQRFTVPSAPLAPDVPLVVLVDSGSASASEIVAGALQDHGRAILIGETTFGKGSVQWPEELSNGAELRVTVARWYTPNDRAIHGEGLEPDLAVELTADDREADRDPQLDRAVEYLLTGK